MNGLTSHILGSVAEFFSQPRLFWFIMSAVRRCFCTSLLLTHIMRFSSPPSVYHAPWLQLWQLNAWQWNFTSFFSFLHNFIDRRLAPTVTLKTLSQNYFISLISREFEPIHLKLAFSSFSLTYLNCQLLWGSVKYNKVHLNTSSTINLMPGDWLAMAIHRIGYSV